MRAQEHSEPTTVGAESTKRDNDMTTSTNRNHPIHAKHVSTRARFARGLAVLALSLSTAGIASGANAAAAVKMTIGESSNGHVVTIARGAHLVITLHTTYWTIAPLTGRTVLAQIGSQQTRGQLSGATHACVPGQGCGTVTMNYVANAAGLVRLSAHRTTCGEAMRCTGSQGTWSVSVRVR